ncbi:hypothetical protein [Gynuella sp.]|uniref:hypothetical protein n=1 Tax=Gynuella sp. TaxID=2969146 RepID=UPI003D0BB8B1
MLQRLVHVTLPLSKVVFGGTMPSVREKTLKELQTLLNRVNPGVHTIVNFANETPFLIISSNSRDDFNFTVSLSESVVGGFITYESPGIYLMDGEHYERANFRFVMQAALNWSKRVKNDLQDQQHLSNKVTSIDHTEINTTNQQNEMVLMKKSQRDIENLLLAQNRKMRILESALARLETELEQSDSAEPTGVRLTL